MKNNDEELLTVKELAFELRRSNTYVYAMIRRGFRMNGYRSTLGSALRWLEENPSPRSRKMASGINGDKRG